MQATIDNEQRSFKGLDAPTLFRFDEGKTATAGNKCDTFQNKLDEE